MPNYLADPVLFAMGLLGFCPDAIQELVLNPNIWRGILNCTRQWGKSTIMAIKALHQALVLDGTTVLVLCPTTKQAGEFFEALRTFLHAAAIEPRGDGHNHPSCRLPNGSRIIGISSLGQVRSYRNVSLLLVDEAAEVREKGYNAIKPALATNGEFGGKIWLMSTPQGCQGFFYEAWADETGLWTRFTATADDCPRISREFLAIERRQLGETLYAQEFMCKFVDPPDCFLNREDVTSAFRSDIPPFWPTMGSVFHNK